MKVLFFVNFEPFLNSLRLGLATFFHEKEFSEVMLSPPGRPGAPPLLLALFVALLNQPGASASANNSPLPSFKIDLKNGDYTVRINYEDQITASAVEVIAEGIVKFSRLSGVARKIGDVAFDVAVIDGQLNLDFIGVAPRSGAVAITGLPTRKAGALPTVYIAGDSTVATYSADVAPLQGWGGRLADYFDNEVVFINKAISGRSSKSFLIEGRLDEILREIKPGDFFLIQFGHNDQTIDDRHTDPFTGYKKYLSMYLDGAIQRGATPVLVTPMGRRGFDSNHKFSNSFSDYASAMNQLAVEKNIRLIDLNLKSIEYYNAIGVEASKKVFLFVEAGIYPNRPNATEDNTHFQEYGAQQLARIIKESIEELAIEPLASHIIK